MQSIERYGIVALLFLVVTVVAVLVWDGETSFGDLPEVAAKIGGSDTAGSMKANAPANRVRLNSPPMPKPLTRDLLEADAGDATLRGEPALEDANARKPERRGGGIVPRNGKGARGNGEKQRAKEADDEREDDSNPLMEPVRDLADFVADRIDDFTRDTPKPEPKRREASTSTGREYVVREGDTLSEIASRELGTWRRWEEIVALNPGLDPSKLFVGKKLKLPTGGAAPIEAGASSAGSKVASEAAGEASPKAGAAKGGATYVVREGDSMWRIAERELGNGERWTEIASLNPKVNADRLLVGEKLVLPSGAIAATPSNVAKSGADTRSRAPEKRSAPVVASNDRPSSTPRRGKVR